MRNFIVGLCAAIAGLIHGYLGLSKSSGIDVLLCILYITGGCIILLTGDSPRKSQKRTCPYCGKYLGPHHL